MGYSNGYTRIVFRIHRINTDYQGMFIKLNNNQFPFVAFAVLGLTMSLNCFANPSSVTQQANILMVAKSPTASVIYTGEQYADKRELFAQFVKDISTGRNLDEKRVLTQLAELKGYPLYSYAMKYWLQASMNVQSPKNISAFLNSYDGQPVARNVRKQWLQKAQDNNDERAFIDFYVSGISAELDCYYLRKTLNDDINAEKLDDKVAPLWLVSYSQPNACDPLFNRWKRAGLISPERQFQRTKLASREGNLQLARFLARDLPSQLQYLVVLWRDAHKSPYKLTNMQRYSQRFPDQEAEVFTHAMRKLVWSRPETVIQSYRKALDQMSLTVLQQQTLARDIALSLAVDDHPEAGIWLERALDLKPEKELLRWQIATKVRHQDWQGTLDAISLAPETLSSETVYDYWQGRSWQQLGAQDKAMNALQEAAKERNYYGFLASAKLQQTPSLNHKSPEWDDEIQLQLNAMPAVQRAYELFVNQRYSEARREWRYAMQTLSGEEQLQGALLAYEWQWYDQTIFGLAKAGYWDDVVRRFPTAFNARIAPFAEEYQVDPAWAFAIARRESSFMVDAISSAGARGLMQVLPATAQYISQKQLPYRSLLEPDTNVSLGIQYLSYLMDKVDNNSILATASYNAGWRRVLNWMPDEQPIDMDIWIETIPFKETRNYVKAVLAYKYIYQIQLGQHSEVFEQLSEMKLKPINTAP